MNRIDTHLKRRIRTVLYQDQRFSDSELDLLHTPSLQRLYDLRQLGFADRVYVDASHTRLAHVLGVMEIATRIVDTILRNLGSDAPREKYFDWGVEPGPVDRFSGTQLRNLLLSHLDAIRLIAMLHDLTHAPFGHTLEDEIRLVEPPHDAPGRQAAAFLKLFLEYMAWTAVEILPEKTCSPFRRTLDFDRLLSGEGYDPKYIEDDAVNLGVALLHSGEKRFGRTKLSSAEFAELFIALNFASRALCHLEISHKVESPLRPNKEYPVNQLIERILQKASKNAIASKWAAEMASSQKQGTAHAMRFEPSRDAYCLDIIGNTICADLLDYAQRDAVQAGLPLAIDLDRIVDNFTLVSYEEHPVADHRDYPFAGPCLRAAVEFSRGKFRGDVIGGLMQLLQVRYYVYERMLFHPTKCVAGAMLGRAIQLLGFKRMPKNWQLMGDAVFLQQLREVGTLALLAIEAISSKTSEKVEADVTSSDPVTGPPYFSALAQELLQAIPSAPISCVEATKDLLIQRVLTIGDLRADYCGERPAALWIERFLHTRGMLSYGRLQAIEALHDVLNDERWRDKDEQQLTSDVLKELAKHIMEHIASISGRDASDVSPSVKAEVTQLVPYLSAVREEIESARMLLARLAARRYAKRIFCLMPGNIAAGDITVERTVIADRFLNPRIRAAAERAIERVAKLPVGSVVIHCPPPEGPKKTARVLMTYIPPGKTTSSTLAPAQHSQIEAGEPRRVTTQLRNIGEIEGPAKTLFKAHEGHLQSLENMYASMWRLWVAVTPPSDKDYEKLGEIISNVMSAVVFAGGAYTRVTNDAFMVEELKVTYSLPQESLSADSVSVTQPPIPISAVKGATTRSASDDRALSKDEIWRILEPYLATYTKIRRRLLTDKLENSGAIARLVDRSREPQIRQFLLSASVDTRLMAPKWDARDIDNFISGLDSMVEGRLANLALDNPVAYRRLSQIEKVAVGKLRNQIVRETVGSDVRNADGAVSVAAIAQTKGVQVSFQPLLTSGLYGVSADQHSIIVNCGRHDPKRLKSAYDSKEAELLPPEIRFTLAHELVHFLISSSSDPTLKAERDDERIRDIAEFVCQELAGELLLPSSTVDALLVGQIMTAGSLKQACIRLGVHPRPIVISIERSSRFQEFATGLAVIYGRSSGDRSFLTVQGTSNKAMAGPVSTLRDIDGNGRLPFNDIVIDAGAEKVLEQQIVASGANPSELVKVRLSMVNWPSESPHSYRIAVVERLDR